jgi:hypothetical protein
MNWRDELRDDWDAAGLRLWKSVVDPVARSWEPQFAETATGLFGEEKRALFRSIDRVKAVPDWAAIELTIEDVLEGREGDWRAGFIPLFQGLSEEFADEWAIALGVDFALTREQVLDFVEAYGFQFVERHQGVTRDAVARLVAQAHDEGLGILDFMAKLQDLYGGWSVLRSEMIARTETIRSENAGSLAAYDAAGVTEVQWWTALDDRVCVFCGEIHGRKWATGSSLFRLGDVFRVGESSLRLNYEDVKHPPLHVFCRCTLLPVV